MTTPTAIFLDTSVLAGQQYNFSSAAIATFLPVAQANSIILLLPDPTEREVVRQIRQRSDDALAALDDARRKAPFLTKWEHFPKRGKTSLDSWQVKKVATEEWKRFLSQFKVERLDYSGVRISEIMGWYDNQLAPFRDGKKRKEFPDALAISMLNAYAHKNDAFVAVVSDDQDFKFACERFPKLMYFQSLPAVTEALLSSEVRVEKLRSAVYEAKPELEQSISYEVEHMRVVHSSDRYEIQDTTWHGSTIDDMHIVAIGANECTVTFVADVEAEHKLRWFEYDHEHEADEEIEEWVLETSKIEGTAKAIFDQKSGEFASISFIEIESPEIEVSETPWRRW